jgi:regulation of enolase protein 1 (concanavalin A-like superfamily)
MHVGTADAPGSPTKTPQPYPFGSAPTPTAMDDSFDSGALNRTIWRNIWGDTPNNWAVEDGELVITARNAQVYQEQNDGQNVFLQQAPAGDWAITTQVTFDAQRNFDQAFLTVWQDSNNYLMLKEAFAGSPSFEASYEDDQTYHSTLATNDIGDTVFLQIRKTGDTYTQSYSPDGVTWTQVGSPVTLPLLDVKVGVGAWSPGSGRAGTEARFDFFDIQ